jgi:hypothetical protein
MKRFMIIFGFLSLLIFQIQVHAIPVQIGDSFLDLPEGFQLISDEAEKKTFVFREDQVYVTWKRQELSVGEEASRALAEEMAAEAEVSYFTYLGMPASLHFLIIPRDGFTFAGYMLVIEKTRGRSDILLAISEQGDFERLSAVVFSSLNSYASISGHFEKLGPIASFLDDDPEYGNASLEIPLIDSKFLVPPGSLETNQWVIETEADLLITYPQGSNIAWERYYRVIYRDLFARIQPNRLLIQQALGADRVEAAKTVLAWFQNFTYERRGGISDLLSPLAACVQGGGDCDSRSLAYLALLDVYGIEGRLLISPEYEHGMAALDLEVDGAKFPIGGKDFVVAELTDRVGIGMIASDMADPGKWMAFRLKY